ncbi:hypothetical protein [Geodermatophilus sp. SYSU D00700]
MTGPRRQPSQPERRLVDYVHGVLAQARPPLPQDRRRPVQRTGGGPAHEADEQRAQDAPQPGQARDAAAAQAEREIMAEAERQQVGIRYAAQAVAVRWHRAALDEGFGWEVAHEAALFVHGVATALVDRRRRRAQDPPG